MLLTVGDYEVVYSIGCTNGEDVYGVSRHIVLVSTLVYHPVSIPTFSFNLFIQLYILYIVSICKIYQNFGAV